MDIVLYCCCYEQALQTVRSCRNLSPCAGTQIAQWVYLSPAKLQRQTVSNLKSRCRVICNANLYELKFVKMEVANVSFTL